MYKTELEKDYEQHIAKLEEEIRWLRGHIDFLSKLVPTPPQPIYPTYPVPAQQPFNPYYPGNPYSPVYPSDGLNPIIITHPWTTCDTNYTIRYSQID